MKKQSAGILLYKRDQKGPLILLVHPGGPFWAKKDRGAWSIPKGEFEEGEAPLVAARREFSEELGLAVPEGELIDLGSVKQAGGKVVYAWALAGDIDPKRITSNTFTMEWPPKSGKHAEFPEVDRAAWFPLDTAATKIVAGQLPLLQVLAERLDASLPSQGSLF